MARRQRDSRSLRRRAPRRQPYDTVLIVCEGSKTEPLYLRELAAVLQLSGANIVVTGEGGSAPKSVVQTAIALFNDAPEFDRVYCVFDKDQHESYREACDRVAQTTLKKRSDGKSSGTALFRSVVSVPCFEYWVLLHFEYTTAAFRICSEVLRRLRGHGVMAGYVKGEAGLYTRTRHLTDVAIARAVRARQAAAQCATDDPTTEVDELICDLRSIRTAPPA